MRVSTVFVLLAKSGSVGSFFFELMKRYVFNLNCIFPEIYGAFSLFIFRSLILVSTNCQIKEDQDNEKYFHPNETTIMFQQLDLCIALDNQFLLQGLEDHRKEGASNTLCLLAISLPSLLKKYPYIADAPCFFFNLQQECLRLSLIVPFFMNSSASFRVYKKLRSTLNGEIKSLCNKYFFNLNI